MSGSRVVVLWFGALVLSLSACQCGGEVNVGGCSSSTCALGCCDSAGVCRTPSAQACGVSGSVCSACSADQSCLSGVCVGGSGVAGVGGGDGTAGGTSGVGGNGGFGGGEEEDASVPYYDGGCGPIDAGNPPFPRRCGPQVASECDGTIDSFLTNAGVGTALRNGMSGNGYDDDCDGQVDEGCTCPSNGLTKDCYLVPATQANPANNQPVGWCTDNAKGSLDCLGGEFSVWSGLCRGGQAPARYDVCAPGDFNCDGLSGNSATTGCMCPVSVECPTTVITQAPYPDPAALPLIDGSQWINDATERANTTNWTWTILGGDCDNVLPYPTFALYNSANSAAANARRGTRTPVRFNMTDSKYEAAAGQPLIAIQATNYGNGVAGGQIHPAFALSGDYIVQGEFDLAGKRYTCTQKVQVRAPGIRAELCWDTVGGTNGTQGNDIDLHFARLQGITCANQGWEDTCTRQDCFYASVSGCNSGSGGPQWGYTDSANTVCRGWGSKRTGTCTNPRLDLDNVTCNRNQQDPNNSTFCGPENINLDNPRDNDSFVVGVNHYDNTSGTSSAKPHVNLYCNGARVLSVGYNPAAGQTGFPVLTRPGDDTSGDMWTAATIKAHVTGGNLTSCDVATIPSHFVDPTRDGPAATGMTGNDVCVDSVASGAPAGNRFNYTSRRFVDPGSRQGIAAGSQPMTPAQWCKH